MMLGGLSEGILMIALALGYIVCYLANREEKNLRMAGLLIGGFVIAFSAIALVGNLLFTARVCGMGKMSRMGRMGMPMMQHKMMPPAPPAAQ